MLLTGVMNHRNGLGNMPETIPDEHRGKPGYDTVMNHRVVTIAQLLKAAGYRTYFTGKWHLGSDGTRLPHARGYDRAYSLADAGAAAFLNYLLKPEVQARFHQLTGYVPVTLEGYELTKQQGFYDKNPGTDIAVKALSDKKPTINSLGLRLGNFVQIRNVIDEELEAVWAGKKTAKQALDDAVARGDAMLRQFERTAGK